MLRFMSAVEEQAGHSRFPSLMLLQSRQRTARFMGIIACFKCAFMVISPDIENVIPAVELRLLARKWDKSWDEGLGNRD